MLTVEHVPLDRLFLNPANPRLNDAAVPHVAASIAASAGDSRS